MIAQTTPRCTDVLLSCAVREITIDCQAEQVPSRAPSSPQGELRNSSPSIGGLFACMPALNPTENTFGEDPDAPLRVAKMQDVHSLLVFRFAAKLSPVHSFLLRGINFAEVLFLWRIRSRRDLNGAAEPEPRNTPFLSRRKRRIRTFMNAPVRTGQDPYSDDKKKERRILSQEYAPFGIDIQVKARIVLPVQL